MARPTQNSTQASSGSPQGWGRFDFLGPSKYLTVFSTVLTLLALAFIFVRGLEYGVDFAGGIETQVKFAKEIDASRMRKFMEDLGYPNANVQAIGGGSEYLLRVQMVQGKSDDETNQYINSTVEKIKAGIC